MHLLAGVLLLGTCLYAQLAPGQKQLNAASFEKVWTTVRDKHWDKNPGGLDWQAVHEEFRPRIDTAETMDQARGVMLRIISPFWRKTRLAIATL